MNIPRRYYLNLSSNTLVILTKLSRNMSQLYFETIFEIILSEYIHLIAQDSGINDVIYVQMLIYLDSAKKILMAFFIIHKLRSQANEYR